MSVDKQSQAHLHLRVAVLNPGPDVSPLKFKGWLREESADVDRRTKASGLPHCAALIRLYLPNRLRYGVGPAKLDRILQDMVDKYETIHQIIVFNTEQTLTVEDIARIEREVRDELSEIGGDR